MKILYGLVRPDSGEIYVNGKKMRFRTPSDAMAAGIGMVQQHFMLFEEMTVAENIVFKNEIHRGPFMDMNKTVETVRALSDKYQLKIDPTARISECPVGLRQRVEILKILYQNAEIIIFDEPSAVLTPLEVDALLETMRQLAAAGKSIVVITHKLQEVMAVSDRVYVMRQGEVVAERMTAETNIEELASPDGRPPDRQPRHPARARAGNPAGDEGPAPDGGRPRGAQGHRHPRRRRRDRRHRGRFGQRPVRADQLHHRPHARDGGQVLVQGQDVTNRSVRAIRDAGLAHIPEDRYVWGSAPEGTLEENALMGRQDSEPFSRRGLTNHGRIREYARKLIADFAVKASSPAQKMRELSGGNAQKLIVAREMSLDTPVLICCEPTRGIDIGAMEAIHDRMVKKRDSGAAVLLVSSELTEIMSLSDRIYVIYEGRINGEFKRDSMDDKALGLLMVGGAVNHE